MPDAILFDDTVDQILFELARAEHKHPGWPENIFEQLAIIGEEFGELQKAALELHYKYPSAHVSYIEEEAIQTAAMVIRLLIDIKQRRRDRGEYISPSTPQKRKTDLTLGERIKTVRKAFKQSQTVFARCIGSHVQTISKYERGEINPSVDTLNSIVDAYSVDPGWLLTGRGVRVASIAINTESGSANVKDGDGGPARGLEDD